MNVAIFWDIAPVIPYLKRLATFCKLVSCLADFDPEDGGDTRLRNVGSHTEYAALYPRRWHKIRTGLIYVPVSASH
jgi:hypothetical protein